MGCRGLLPIMLMAGMWMIGCGGAQKPKMAPANTALGTLQRAEIKLKEGKEAQKKQDYKVALASHLEAVEMAESISTKYPKDPTTAKFLKKPMLGKVWVDDVKLKAIPLLRQQSLISEDILGWAIVEIEQLEANQRPGAYTRLFNALFRNADVERLKWLVRETKGKVSQKTLDRWTKRINGLKDYLSDKPNFATRGKLFNRVFNSTQQLDTQYQTFFEQALKEPNRITKLVLLRAMYEHISNNPNSALAKDRTTQKQLIAARLWAASHQNSSRAVTSYLKRVIRDHKMLGFDSKQAIGQHLLTLIQARIWDEKKINAMYAFLDKTEIIQDKAQRQRLLIETTRVLLKRFDPKSKTHKSMIDTGFYALINKPSANTQTLSYAAQLLSKVPNESLRRRFELIHSKITASESKTMDLAKLALIPKLGPADQPTYTNASKILAPLALYPTYIKRSHELGDKKALKVLSDRITMGQKDFDAWVTQVNLPARFTKIIGAKFHQLRAALAATDDDTKAVIAHLKKITDRFKPSEYVLDESFAITTQFAVTTKLPIAQAAALDEQIAMVASSATFKHSVDAYEAWLKQKIQQRDTQGLNRWFDGIYQGLPQTRGLDALTAIYLEIEKQPTDTKITKWIVSKLNTFSPKHHRHMKLNRIFEMCQMPKHHCMGQLTAYFKSGKLDAKTQRRIINDLLNNDQITSARQLHPLVQAGKHQWLASAAVMQWDLKQTGHFTKPKLEMLLSKMAQAENVQRADWQAFYKVFTTTGRCPELNALLKKPALKHIDTSHAAEACLKNKFNYTHDHPAATLNLINKANTTTKRLDLLVFFINKYGVIETPSIKKLRQQVAASKN